MAGYLLVPLDGLDASQARHAVRRRSGNSEHAKNYTSCAYGRHSHRAGKRWFKKQPQG
jgi:hypothetical protein